MKRTNKVIAILMLIALLTMSLFANSVNASATISQGDANSTVTITRNVTGVTNNVTNTFGYTITPDSTYNGTKTVTGSPTVGNIVFSDVAPNAGTATQTGTVNFAGVTFSDVGDYRFILTETSTTDSTKYPRDTSTYYLYVSVRYANDGTTMVATVAGNGIKDNTNDQNAQTNPGTKTAVVFTSGAALTNITITKTVTGNMGDRSKYFDVPVTITGETGETYTVSGGSYAQNPTSLTSGTQATLKIKHGETITIGVASNGTTKQIPIGASYTVSETQETGYTTQIDSVERSTITKTTDADPSNNGTAIVNNYELATLTGVFFNIMPYILIAGIVLVLIVLLKRSSKKSRR